MAQIEPVDAMASVSDMEAMGVRKVSADSHVVEPPTLFTEGLPGSMQAIAPYVTRDASGGDVYVVPGLDYSVPLGFARPAADDGTVNAAARVDELRPGSWDPAARLGDQDRDGVRAEVLYPTLGLVLFRLRDTALREACFDVYNDWLAGFCRAAPERLLSVAMVDASDAGAATDMVRRVADRGFAGVIMPIAPLGGDYDDPAWRPVFQTLAEAGLPLSFHAIGGPARTTRGPVLARLATQPTQMQELLSLLVLGGVLDQCPDLRVVLAESDASWAPHLCQRMDRIVVGHGGWASSRPTTRQPSEAVASQVWFAFAHDTIALRDRHHAGSDRLMWANDYPHSEGSWPRSDAELTTGLAGVPEGAARRFVHDTAAALYAIGPTGRNGADHGP